jgi:hypothetical protein
VFSLSAPAWAVPVYLLGCTEDARFFVVHLEILESDFERLSIKKHVSPAGTQRHSGRKGLPIRSLTRGDSLQ